MFVFCFLTFTQSVKRKEIVTSPDLLEMKML